ncbi:hypothetical protein GCM10009122_36170 [Fulvivirga kasyanovii]|uniref:Uncharacterized protein n=1 Tax=Fulvivirga kasyanovii TaxID=396812 RepID=A0ABW9RUS8_9BACT|nr:hypothetical protein [Fulvivirga kasyanovii]MTI27447.1 hypothetical protein [Fulvivirga kasyanovii]
MKKYADLIFENLNIPLSSIPYHFDVKGVDRFFAEGFPAHLAIHKINAIDKNEEQYTKLHSHDDEDEINILIPEEGKKLVYEIQLGDEVFEVEGAKSIWMPAGLKHASNVISGSGYFVAIRIKKDTVNKNELAEMEESEEQSTIVQN